MTCLGSWLFENDGLKLGWLRGKYAEGKAKVVFVQRKSEDEEIVQGISQKKKKRKKKQNVFSKLLG